MYRKTCWGKMTTLWVVILLLSLLSHVRGQEVPTYYVSPSPDTDLCPSEPCLMLSNYTASPEQYFVSGATFVFLPGVHNLSVDGFVVVRDIANLSLVGSENASIEMSGEHLIGLQPVATIMCSVERSGFAFFNVSNLHIGNLEFSLCGAVIPPALATEALTVQTTSTFVIQNNTLKAALFLVSVHSLEMSSVLVNHSIGYGLLGVNVIGKVLIQRCYFLNNNLYTYFTNKCRFPLDISDTYECVGGNARLLYSDPAECPSSAETYTVRIHQSTFAGGVDLYGSLLPLSLVNRGTGLGVSFAQRTYGVRLTLTDADICGNTGSEGANIFFMAYNDVENTSLVLQNCIVSHGNMFYSTNAFRYNQALFSTYGVGMSFFHGLLPVVHPQVRPLVCNNLDYKGEATQEILAIYNSSFVNNIGYIGVGMYLSVHSHNNNELKRAITIDGTIVSFNIGNFGSALLLSENLVFPQLDVTIVNSEFSYNTLTDELFLGFKYPLNQFGTLAFFRAKNVSITNCVFQGNNFSAISASSSRFTFKGQVSFSSNTGFNGGAIGLLGESVLVFKPHLQMNFIGNIVSQTGGAISVSGDYLIDPECFFQVNDPTFLPTSELDIRLTFENNTALEAGDVLFGGTIDRCSISMPSVFAFHDTISDGGEIFDFLTDIKQEESNSLISSNPEGACICVEERPDCKIQNSTFALFPGQSFQISLVAVGQRQGVVPAVMRSYYVLPSTAKFGPLQELQDTERHCVNLTYTVFTSRELETIEFLPDNAIPIGVTPQVTVHLLPCPVGFQLSQDLGTCSCSQVLHDRDVVCDIEHEAITRSPPYWFSAVSGELAFHDHCPFDYCHDETVEMNLAEPDAQCAFDRTGVLCGGCTDGLSLSLGTSKCKKCSNLYLLLIIPFAIMGILLVVILSGLNLTVKIGTIHGLIFYANVVKINQAAFFPSGEVSFFTVFLSWLNLDFGIESCFFDGLDTYSKTWLQFAFPLYIWGIGIIIIISAHYSTRVSEAFSNAVHVLDTLFLLSYTKILRAITTALSFTIVEYEGDKGDEKVWFSDGNLSYGEGKHIPLIVFACFFLLLAIPYTLILLFAQFLRRYSHQRAFKWVAKIKPHLDAYTGPYKNVHGYWTGLLLLARVMFVLVCAFDVLGDPAVNVLIVTIISFLLAVLAVGTGGVYKTRGLNILEVSMLVNLGVLSAATSYVSEAGGNQQALVYTSVSIVLVEFIGILIYHVILRLKERYSMKWLHVPDGRQYLRVHNAPQADPRGDNRPIAEEQLAVGLEQLIRPGAEGLFDDEPGSFTTTYVDVRDLRGRD